jgi:hypothetical protein
MAVSSLQKSLDKRQIGGVELAVLAPVVVAL